MTADELEVEQEYYCEPLQQTVTLKTNPPNLPVVVVITEDDTEYVVLRSSLS